MDPYRPFDDVIRLSYFTYKNFFFPYLPEEISEPLISDVRKRAAIASGQMSLIALCTLHYLPQLGSTETF